MSIHKLAAVQRALEHPGIAEWFLEQHNTTTSDFTVQNVREYGLDGMGGLADVIILNGVAKGVLPTEAQDF